MKTEKAPIPTQAAGWFRYPVQVWAHCFHLEQLGGIEMLDEYDEAGDDEKDGTYDQLAAAGASLRQLHLLLRLGGIVTKPDRIVLGEALVRPLLSLQAPALGEVLIMDSVFAWFLVGVLC